MIGILSDSHDNVTKIRQAVELFKGAGCDLVLHAGDFVAPFAAKELAGVECPVRGVFGNCDGEKRGLLATVQVFGEVREEPFDLEWGGRRIRLVHMDGGVEEYARSGLFDVVIFGHTHRPEVREVEYTLSGDAQARLVKVKTLVINPGEAGGWLSDRCTVALYDPATGKAEIHGL